MRRHEEKIASQLNLKVGKLSVRTFLKKRGINWTKETSKKNCKQKICSQRGKVIKGPFTNSSYMKPARESIGLTYNQDTKEILQENKNYKFSASPIIGEAKGSFHVFWHINPQRQFWSNQSKQQQVTNAFTKSCEELKDKIAYQSAMLHNISGSKHCLLPVVPQF